MTGRETTVTGLPDRGEGVLAIVGGWFTLRPADPDRDASLLHPWMHDPEVEPFWEMAWPSERIAGYLRAHPAHSTAYLGLLAGTPMSYWELYRADLDPLAAHYPARPHDMGLHLLLGPPGFRGRGLGAELLRAVSDWLFARDTRTTRVVAEPDVRNTRSVRAFERAGFDRAGELTLGGKRAALMIRRTP